MCGVGQNDYDTEAGSVFVTASRLINTGTAAEIEISFDISVGGEALVDENYQGIYPPMIPKDYVMVGFVHQDSVKPEYWSGWFFNPDAESCAENPEQDYGLIPFNVSGRYFLYDMEHTRVSAIIPNPEPNGVYKLVFMWTNNSEGGTGICAEIDNLSVKGINRVVSSLPYNTDFQNSQDNACWYFRKGAKWTSCSEWDIDNMNITGHNALYCGCGQDDYYQEAIQMTTAEHLVHVENVDTLHLEFDLIVGGQETVDGLTCLILPIDTDMEIYDTLSYLYANLINFSSTYSNFLFKDAERQSKFYTVSEHKHLTVFGLEKNKDYKLTFLWANNGDGLGDSQGPVISNLSLYGIQSSQESQSSDPKTATLPYSHDFSLGAYIYDDGGNVLCRDMDCWKGDFGQTNVKTNIWIPYPLESVSFMALGKETEGVGYTGYNENSPTFALAYRTVHLGNSPSIKVKTKVDVGGEKNFDYLQVYLLADNVELKGNNSGYNYLNVPLYDDYRLSSQDNTSSFVYHNGTIEGIIKNPNPNGLANIVFAWTNNAALSYGTNVKVYNISLEASNIEVVGLEEITKEEKNSIILYPNPAKDILNAEINEDAAIYNVLGAKVREIKNPNGKTQINISDLERGFYYIKTSASSKKFIKE